MIKVGDIRIGIYESIRGKRLKVTNITKAANGYFHYTLLRCDDTGKKTFGDFISINGRMIEHLTAPLEL